MPTKNEGLYALDASEVRAGQQWKHLKTGGTYTVIATGLDEASLAPVVVYKGSDDVVWVRSLKVFLENTEQGRPRFILLVDADSEEQAQTDRFRRVHPAMLGLRELAEVAL